MANIVWKNLSHQPARFALSTGGVAFAVLLMLIVQGLHDGILTQATAYARTVDAQLWVSQAATRPAYPINLLTAAGRREGGQSPA